MLNTIIAIIFYDIYIIIYLIPTIYIIDDYQKFDSHKKARQVYELVVPFLLQLITK